MFTSSQKPKASIGEPVHSNVRQITNAIIRRAMKENSSDIHIIPLAEHSTIRFRIKGDLSEPIRIPISLHEQVISFFRNLSGLTAAEEQMEEHIPQGGHCFEVRAGAVAYNMEIESRPSSHGEYIVLHVCKNKLVKQHGDDQPLHMAGIHHKNTPKITQILQQKSGVILLAGPFGSGKTTTMYSFLNYLHTQGKKAISFEQSIDMNMPNVVQIPYAKDIGQFMVAEIFNHVEREKPDIIMIDHLGDHASAAAAFELSARGHLVISGIRAVDTASVLSNLKAHGISNAALGRELKLSLTQRLLHRLCPECHEIRPADPRTLVRFDLPSDTASFNPKGCKDCMGTGFSGRTPVHETCIIDTTMASMLQNGIPELNFRNMVINAGMLTLFEDALIKALEGLIPLEEVLRLLPNPILEHTIGARLQGMHLLPDNKNLLVSTGDAEAMINQDKAKADDTVKDPMTITQNLRASMLQKTATRPTQENTADQSVHLSRNADPLSADPSRQRQEQPRASATLPFQAPSPSFQPPISEASSPKVAAQQPTAEKEIANADIPLQENHKPTSLQPSANAKSNPVSTPSTKSPTLDKPQDSNDETASNTMRFQAATTPPRRSVANVLQDTLRLPSEEIATKTQSSPAASTAHAQQPETTADTTTQAPINQHASAFNPIPPMRHHAESQQPTSYPDPAQPTPHHQEAPQSASHFNPTNTLHHHQSPQSPSRFPPAQSRSHHMDTPQASHFNPATQQAQFQQAQPAPPFHAPAPSFEQQTQAFQPPLQHPAGHSHNHYFQFETPRQQTHVAQQEATPKVRKKLLLVEDGHTMRDYISFILRSGGYDVVDVETAEEALSILFHERPDALISDHILPGMNGTSLIATIRSHPRLCDIPTMLLTSEAKMEVEALRTGADSYLEKPVDPDLLLARLGSLIAAYDRMSS